MADSAQRVRHRHTKAARMNHAWVDLKQAVPIDGVNQKAETLVARDQVCADMDHVVGKNSGLHLRQEPFIFFRPAHARVLDALDERKLFLKSLIERSNFLVNQVRGPGKLAFLARALKNRVHGQLGFGSLAGGAKTPKRRCRKKTHDQRKRAPLIRHKYLFDVIFTDL